MKLNSEIYMTKIWRLLIGRLKMEEKQKIINQPAGQHSGTSETPIQFSLEKKEILVHVKLNVSSRNTKSVTENDIHKLSSGHYV